MKKTILSVLLIIASSANFSCFASAFSSSTLKSPTDNLLLKRRGHIAPKNPLIGQKKQYLHMQAREQRIQEKKEQLKSEGKTPEEIRKSFTSPERDTPESKDTWEKVMKSNMAYDKYKQAQNEYQQNPSSDTLAALKKAKKDNTIAQTARLKADDKNTTIPEFRAAYPNLAAPIRPVSKLNFFTGKPTSVSSKPIMQPRASQDSLWNQWKNRFWRTLGY